MEAGAEWSFQGICWQDFPSVPARWTEWISQPRLVNKLSSIWLGAGFHSQWCNSHTSLWSIFPPVCSRSFPCLSAGAAVPCRPCCCPCSSWSCSGGPILTAAVPEPCSTCTKMPQVTQNTIFNVVRCWSSSEPNFKGDSPQCLWTEWAVGMSLELEFAQFAFQQCCHLSKGMISIQRWKSCFFFQYSWSWLCWLPPLGLILTYLNSYNLLFLSLF